MTAAAPAATPGANLPLYVFAATTCVGLAFLGLWTLPPLRSAIARHRASWTASEAHAFRELEHACRGDDPAGIYRAFTTWRQRVDDTASLTPFAEEIESVAFAMRPWSRQQSAEFVIRLAAERVPHERKGTSRGLSLLNSSKSMRRAWMS